VGFTSSQPILYSKVSRTSPIVFNYLFFNQNKKGVTMSGRSTFSDESYKRVDEEVSKDGGPATKKGEQRHREGKGG
jgi:hypothetical protein